MTRTAKLSGAPGIGVHGVGTHAATLATNGTITAAEPALSALMVAVNVSPVERVETRETTFVSEI
jgi:hypothetical protein